MIFVLTYLSIAVLVFVTNLIPVFMPATWTVLSYIAVSYNVSILPLAFVGAISATLGRAALAKFSQTIIRQKILSEKTRGNIDIIKKQLEGKKALAATAILFYAFSPFPSSQLFIAYGLTGMELRYIMIPFFIGRLCSYTFFAFSATKIVHKFFPYSFGSFLGGYFLLAQFLTLGSIYIFAKIDWHELFAKKKIKFL